MLPVLRAMGRVGGAVFCKTALRLRGLDVGDTRLPLPPATDEQVAAIAGDLTAAGVALDRSRRATGALVPVSRPPARSDRSRSDRRSRSGRRDQARPAPPPPDDANPAELPADAPPGPPGRRRCAWSRSAASARSAAT